MSTVTLKIGPKSYPVACADGEEAHVEALGAIIAEKYALLGQARAPLEAQNVLFVALFLADELAEARKGKAKAPAKNAAKDTSEADGLRAEIVRLEAELAEARKAPSVPEPRSALPQADLFASPALSADLAERLEALAARAEESAAALEALAANA